MYIDDTIIASLLVVGATITFVVGFGLFVYNGVIEKNKADNKDS